MNSSTPGHHIDFATLVDAAEDRLPPVSAERVRTQLRDADPETRAAASWIRSFLEAARRHRRGQVPPRVRSYLERHYAQWWQERTRSEPDLDWDGLAARLVFDSRRAVNLVGVRGISSDETVQLAYALGDADVVIDLSSTGDDAVRVEGQVLTTESQPRVTPVSVLLRGSDEEPRYAALDQLDRFAFEPAYGPGLELLVRIGRRRWRLSLGPHRRR